MFFLYFQPISLLKKRILKYSLNFSIIWIDYVINLRSKTLFLWVLKKIKYLSENKITKIEKNKKRKEKEKEKQVLYG